MLTDLDALLAGVLAEPACDTARLVYADALEETQVPANVARAEFIRVQCELAKMVRPCDKCGNASTEYAKFTARCRGVRCSLRRREYECSKRYIVWDWLGGVDSGLTPFVNGGDWNRGFVHTVCGPLAALRGGECVMCNWEGGRRRLELKLCSRCHGTGSIGGILRNLVRREPVEVVEVADKRPMGRDDIWHWGGAVGAFETTANYLPLFSKLWKILNDGVPNKEYPTESAARAALSLALLDEAKGLVPA